MIKNKHIGTLKLMIERTMGYGSMINFVMLLYLYVKGKPFGYDWYYWILLLLVGLPMIAIIDWKIVFPAALSISFGKKNQEFMQVKDKVDVIEEKLDLLIKNSGAK